MRSFQDIERIVDKKLKYKWEIQQSSFGEVMSFEVPIDERKQTCIARIWKHPKFGKTVEILTLVGKLDKSDLKKSNESLLALMMLNQQLFMAKTQVTGENLYIVARTLAPSCTNKEFTKMVQEVALYADILEQKMMGKDDN